MGFYDMLTLIKYVPVFLTSTFLFSVRKPVMLR